MVKFLIYIFLSSLANASCSDLLDTEVKVLNQKEYKNLCEYSGKTILVVNTASKCGFTYQYEQLEELYRKYVSEGFVVLGFPSNFLYQEFDEESQVEEFVNHSLMLLFHYFQLQT